MSNARYDEIIARELAAITQPIASPAVAPLGYGVDLDCVTDCTDDFAELDPSSPRGIAQALLRRYQTRRGMIDDPDYGLDVRSYCNRGVDVAELRSLATRMAAEARKDDRVASASVTVDFASIDGALDCTVEITPAIPGVDDFTLTFAVTDAGVLIDSLQITGGA